MIFGAKNRIQNRLWLTRKRRGLKQKQIAYLLNHRSVDQISRYENGSRTPKLLAALKLEIIFGVPVRLLFPELHEQLTAEIRERAETSPSLKESLTREFGDGACSYSELLSSPTRSSQDIDTVRRHVTELARTIAHL